MEIKPQPTTFAHAGFLTTHWSVVLGATAESSPTTVHALEALCAAYWPPLYAYARRAGLAPPDAQDAIQDFLNQILQRTALASVSPAKGKFRSWLLGGLKNFLVSGPGWNWPGRYFSCAKVSPAGAARFELDETRFQHF